MVDYLQAIGKKKRSHCRRELKNKNISLAIT